MLPFHNAFTKKPGGVGLNDTCMLKGRHNFTPDFANELEDIESRVLECILDNSLDLAEYDIGIVEDGVGANERRAECETNHIGSSRSSVDCGE